MAVCFNHSVYVPSTFWKTIVRYYLKCDIQRDVCHTLFLHQNGMQFYWYFLENIQLGNNKVDSFEALYRTMALISVELLCKELVAELVRLALDIQVCLYM